MLKISKTCLIIHLIFFVFHSLLDLGVVVDDVGGHAEVVANYGLCLVVHQRTAKQLQGWISSNYWKQSFDYLLGFSVRGLVEIYRMKF